MTTQSEATGVAVPGAARGEAVERWRWDTASYYAAHEAGVFGEDDRPRVELVEGEVYLMASMLSPHAWAIVVLGRQARNVDPERFVVRVQLPLHLDDRNEPEPDFAITSGPLRAYRDRHPGPADVLLAVEVADRSIHHDRDRKLPVYAGAGIRECWLVSVAERCLTRYRGPDPEAGRYRHIDVFAPGDTVDHVLTGLQVAVADLFVPQESAEVAAG